MNRSMAGNERGLSLIEVVLALGLLAGVLVSISGLFILSERQVKSGRTSTEALAVGRMIIEEMNSWAFRPTYELFGFDGSASSYSVDTRTNAFAQKWQAVLDDGLQNGSFATIDIRALGPGGPSLATCRAIRVGVTVSWSEGRRERSVRVATVRM